MNFLRIPVDGVGFNKFSLKEINFRGFSVHEAQFRGFPLNGNKFLGFSRMKLISIGSHSTSFMLHGVTNADRFFPWFSEYLKLTSLLFSVNFFPKIFLKKRSTCFSLRWIWFRCLSLSMTSIFFLRFFVREIVFLDFYLNNCFLDENPIWKNWVLRASNQLTRFFWDAPTIFIQ